jgi:hypothetical protein
MAPEIETKPDELFEEAHDRFDKAVVVTIVVTALLAAITGFAQIRALQHHDAAIARSDRASALASQVSFTWNGLAQLQIDRFRLSENARLRMEQAAADARFNVGPPVAASLEQASQWGVLYRTLQRTSTTLTSGSGGFAGADGMVGQSEQLIAASAPELSSALSSSAPACPGVGAIPPPATVPGAITNSGPDGPGQDTAFPTRYLSDNRRLSYQLQAQGLLSSENALDQEKQFTRFGVSLTMFATAVFLFGFALSPYGRSHRHLYCTGATLLVIGSTAWGIYALVNSPSTPSPQAATAYAAGRVALDKGDRADYLLARRLFTCAISRDKQFGPAYTARAAADNSITDPSDPTGAANTELVGTQYTAQAMSDLSHAKALGAEDATLPAIAGTDVFEAGLRHRSRPELEEGLHNEEEALGILAGTTNERVLLSLVRHPASVASAGGRAAKARSAILLGDISNLAFNIAEAELALGNTRASRSAYRSAVALANAQDTQTGNTANAYVSSALTDLNDLERYLSSPAQAAEIRMEKGYVAGQFDYGSQPDPSMTGIGMTLGPQLTVLPSLAQFAITKLGKADQFSVDAQWYFRPSHNSAWSAFPYLNGAQYPLRPTSSGYVANDSYWPALALNSTCLPSGDYKVEAYVSGHLAASAEGHVAVMRAHPATLRDMGVTLCVPSAGSSGTWSELQPDPGRGARRIPGVEDGFLSPGGKAGILVFDVSAESYRQRCAAGLTRQFIARNLNQFAGSLPSPLEAEGTSKSRFPAWPSIPFLGGAVNTPVSLYAYPGGMLAATAGVTAQNRVLVGVVFGPLSLFEQDRDIGTGAPVEVAPAPSLLGSVSSTEGTLYPDSCS